MKSLQETLNENLVKGTSRLRIGNEELFDSPQVSHEDIKNAMKQVGDLYNRLKQIESDLRRCEKQGIASASLSDPKNFKAVLKNGDKMRATMFGKEWDCTVIGFAWDEDRDACIPIGKNDNDQVIIPQLRHMWYKIDD